MLHDTALPVLALPAHRSHVLSARPDAPVVPHRVAGWVEPRPATRSGMIGCQLH